MFAQCESVWASINGYVKLDRTAQLTLLKFAFQLRYLGYTYALMTTITDLLTLSEAFAWGE